MGAGGAGHGEGSNTWSRRAHEPSVQAMLACLTCIFGEKATVLANLVATPKPTINDWSIPDDLPSRPPGLLSTPQVSWQPYSDTNSAQNSWVFRKHVPRPPDEPAAVKPVVPEIVHPIQYGITRKRFLLPQSDTEPLVH